MMYNDRDQYTFAEILSSTSILSQVTLLPSFIYIFMFEFRYRYSFLGSQTLPSVFSSS